MFYLLCQGLILFDDASLLDNAVVVTEEGIKVPFLLVRSLWYLSLLKVCSEDKGQTRINRQCRCLIGTGRPPISFCTALRVLESEEQVGVWVTH